jgi:flagellar biosynthesis/type III secretory pathway protein FliH
VYGQNDATRAEAEFTMVTKRYLEDKWLKPLLEKQKAEHRAKGNVVGYDRHRAKDNADRRAKDYAEGFTKGYLEGFAEGRDEEGGLWATWNHRRIKAEARGESFDEPPPGF